MVVNVTTTIMNNEIAKQQQNENRLFNKQKQKQQQQLQESSTDDDDDESRQGIDNKLTNNNNSNVNNNNNNNVRRSPETTNERVQFALRLGYSEQLIHKALARLGTEAKENELLAELIKLSDASKLATNSNGIGTSLRYIEMPQIYVNTSVLRHIVIDGSNVALSHGNNEVFSCRGIRICIDWFRQRGHHEITAFVPNWRKESVRVNNNNHIIEQEILYELERERVLVFTPSRLVDGKRVACYDDRYILKLAAETDGIVVSNDNYRDLVLESAEFRKVIKERILMYTFVNDRFMPPDDPLGRSGPSLDIFLRSNQQLCPYGKKCTYGNKCKYRHQYSLTHPTLKRMGTDAVHSPLTASMSAPLNFNIQNGPRELLNRTMSNTVEQQQNMQPAPQLFNQQYNLAQSTPMVAHTPQNTSPTWQANNMPDDLATNFQYTMNLHNGDEINRHKKLQRQIAPLPKPLTNGYEMHRTLMPTISAPPPCIQQPTPRHPHLTRIPSAPVTADTLQVPQLNNYGLLSVSDSHINEEFQQRSAQLPLQEQRRLLRFHLCSLFPQHQVDTVLQMYTNVTDAKTICAAIINLFPNN